jgi:hypothetical protein
VRAGYTHDTHQEHGRADPPELEPGRADEKLGARMLCMQPSATLSVEPCAFKVTPSLFCPLGQIAAHAKSTSSEKGTARYTRSCLLQPCATCLPDSSTQAWQTLLCQVTHSETSTPNTSRYGLIPFPR